MPGFEPEAVYLGMHSHLYQPPREAANGSVRGEKQQVEAQYPELTREDERLVSWNDVEAKLSYNPNAQAGNFERISFNLAPTLAQYLQRHHSETYDQIVAAPDNVRAAGESPNVLGTPYFHAIMPLLPEHDQRTLLDWGRHDAERRFGVEPDGIWLPEMAMDERTLSIARQHGYGWTYGFPHQLKGKVGAPTAYDVPVDGGSMKILRESSHDGSVWGHFYEGDLPAFYQQLEHNSVPETPYPQMTVKASDGEHIRREYDQNGHPLEGLVERLASAPGADNPSVRWVRPTDFMAEVQVNDVPLPQAELAGTTAGKGTFDDRMAQSRGLDRWTGEWNGEAVVPWKHNLQQAYSGFSEQMDAAFEQGMDSLGLDGKAWDMRNDYVRLLSGESSVEEFFAIWDSSGALDGEQRQQALKLLTSQYHKLAAATSCGWFFDKPSGLEPRIVARQMRIALEHLRTSTIDDLGESTEPPESAAARADMIEDGLLEQLHSVADERARLSQVYKHIGAASVRSLLVPAQHFDVIK